MADAVPSNAIPTNGGPPDRAGTRWSGHVLDVLHDPTRRHVLELLRAGEQSVRELTDQTSVSQSAVSQHLKVLRTAGLVDVRPVGTRRLYRVDPNGLSQVRAWVDSFWDDALAAFKAHAEGEDT